MCISQDRGGHHGRLMLPVSAEVIREVSSPESTHSMADTSHDRKWPRRVSSSSNHQQFKHQYQVQHHYVDHSADSCASESVPEVDMEHMDKLHFPGMFCASRCPMMLCPIPVKLHVHSHALSSFTVKLHAILDHIEEDGLANVVSWLPHGRAFRIHNQAIFLSDVMPRYFHQSKLASFQRQLNLYGFQRITKGTDKGSYYHPLMLRGKEFLAHQITRTRVKGTGVRPRSNPEQEPDFYVMPPIDDASPAPIKREQETKKTSRSPSPAVTDHRSPKEKLETPSTVSSSNVVPYETTSCSTMSEVQSSSGDMDIDDQVIIFEGQTFHYLDPYEMVQERQPQPALDVKPTLVPSMRHEQDSEDDDDAIFTGEQMNAMMASLKEPGGIWNINIDNMDDTAFGNVLENLVINGRYMAV